MQPRFCYVLRCMSLDDASVKGFYTTRGRLIGRSLQYSLEAMLPDTPKTQSGYVTFALN